MRHGRRTRFATRLAVLLHFDDAGDVISVSAQDRPRAADRRTVETPFAGEVGNYDVLGGVRVPEGLFVYFRGQITELD